MKLRYKDVFPKHPRPSLGLGPRRHDWTQSSASFVLLFSFLLILFSVLLVRVPFGHAQGTPYTWSPQIQDNLDRPISLDLREIDVVDVLKFLSTKAELNIVTSQNVKSRVTLFLKNVSISNALDIILLSSGLAVREKTGILYVMTEEEYLATYGESYRDQRIVKILPVKYADATKVGEILGGVKSAVGKIIIDSQTATIFIIDTADKVELMLKMAKSLDIATVERILPTQTEVFELNYNKVADLEAQVKVLLTKNVGTVQADVSTNRLIVTDFPHAIEKVRTMIKAFDRKTRQVYLETKMLQIRLSDDYEMGISWDQVFNQGPERNKFRVTNSGDFAIDSATTRFGRMIVGVLGREDIEATIDLVNAFGHAETLASPQLTVEHGEEATILVGTREAYVTSTVSQADSTTTTSESITFVDVGVQLKVKPEINEEGYISMRITPEISAVGDELSTSNGNTIPIVDTTQASTQVTVKNGHTVLIGGLIKNEVQKGVEKYPMLGDMPLVGALFRHTKDAISKTELVIFITPHIVNGDEFSPGSMFLPKAPGVAAAVKKRAASAKVPAAQDTAALNRENAEAFNAKAKAAVSEKEWPSLNQEKSTYNPGKGYEIVDKSYSDFQKEIEDRLVKLREETKDPAARYDRVG